jgi:hypothetical protein
MSKPLKEVTAAAAATALIEGLNASRPNYMIKAEALDGNGDATVSGVTGTVTFEVITRAGDLYEPLNDAEGSPVSIDLSAPATVIVEASVIKQVLATPAAIAGATSYRVRVYES